MKIRPGHTISDLALRKTAPPGFYWQHWRGSWVLRKKPRHYSAGETPLQADARARFAAFGKALNNVAAWDRVEAEAVSWGTLLTWRDVIARAWVGRLVVIDGELPEMSYPDLDMIGVTPGSLLFRDPGNWLILPPGSAGKVLTMDGGMPNWRDAPGAGPAAPARGLFSGLLGDLPTQTNTGLTGTAGTGVTVTDTAAGVFLNTTGGGIAFTSSVPGTPYKVSALVSPHMKNNVAGLGWYDGTKLHFMYAGTPFVDTARRVNVQKNSAVNTYSGTDVQITTSLSTAMQWLQIADDGTNIAFRCSLDGYSWFDIYTHAKSSAYLGSAGYSKLMIGAPGAAGTTTVMGWRVE